MSERWKPEYNDEYFFVECDGIVTSADWDDCEFDQHCFAAGNCFKTKKEAEYAAIKVKDLLLSLHYGSAIDIVTKDALVEAGGAMKLDRALLELFENNKESQADLQDKTTSIQDKPLQKLTAEVFDRPDCPEWAKWAAVDKYRNAMWYEGEPQVIESVFWFSQRGQSKEIPGRFDESDWQNSLIERHSKLPDWWKVGALVYHKKDKQYEKVFCASEGSTWIDEYSPARLRPYNAEEMKALVGKVISHQLNAYLCVGFHRGNETVDYGPYRHTEQDLLKTGATIDGRPCGVLEHLENGWWVE